jgi:hypothetical protein
LLIEPERIESCEPRQAKNDIDTVKKELAAIEKDERGNNRGLDRLLNLYLEGSLRQAGYVVKSSELESEADRLAQAKSELQRRIQNRGKYEPSTELIQTIQLLSRSHERFTEEQKVRVFRSLLKEARITDTGVEFEMYSQPAPNVWWKCRQKVPPKNHAIHPDAGPNDVYAMADVGREVS